MFQNQIITWMLLLLLPLIPVMLLYLFFDSQNFFSVNDQLIKGLSFAGPIAAYAVLLYWSGNFYIKNFFPYKQLRQENEQLTREKDRQALIIGQQNEEIEKLQDFIVSEEIANKLKGNWTFTSVSKRSNRELKGTVIISFNKGILKFSGQVFEKGERIGVFHSEIAQMTSNNELVIIYVLTEAKNNVPEFNKGVCTFYNLNSPQIMSMVGDWVVIGKDGMFGTTNYIKENYNT